MKVKGIEIPTSEMRRDPELWMQNCIRMNNGLGDKDYQLILAIQKSQNENYKKLGNDFCWLSKENLGRQVGLSRSNLIIHLNKVIAKGFVERNLYVPMLLKVTPKWHIEIKKYQMQNNLNA